LIPQPKLVSFEQVKNLQAKEKKLVMVVIETDWCKFCHATKQTVLHNKIVSGILKEFFYTVFLNAEEKNDISFGGRKFKHKPTGVNTGIHQLAEQLGTINGQISYPSICFLNEGNEIIYQHAGYLNPESLTILLTKLSQIDP
jgi:thioredoxin-related protein